MADFLEGTVAPKDGPIDYEGPGLDPEGNGLTELPPDVQALLQTLARKVSMREQWARIREIWDTTEQRYFYKSQQHGFRNRDAGIYQVSQQGGGYNQSGDGSVQPTFRKPFNIYLGYAKSFMAAFCQNEAPVRFEEEDPKDSTDIQAAREANKMKRIIDKFNPPKSLQTKIAKFLWTDPRVVSYTRYVTDGQRFGFEDEPFPDEAEEGMEQETPARQPKGREVIDIYGALETKVPLNADSIHDWDFCKISTDHPVSQLKAEYPDKAGRLTGGSIGDVQNPDQMARMARIGTRQGARQISEDSIAHLGTKNRYWFRPSLYWEFEDTDREKLLDLFPDGAFCVFCGSTYCESRNESMDDHIAVMHGVEDEGEGRNSLGFPEVPIQKEFNDGMNSLSEMLRYCIPFTHVDPEAIDIDAIQEQQSEYGNYNPLMTGARQPGEAVANLFYTEPTVEFPQTGALFLQELSGTLSQFITGQQPALFGGEMTDQKTARGYAMARDQALGQMSLVWVPFTNFRATYMQQAVRIAAQERTKRGQTNVSVLVSIPGRQGQMEPVEVALEEMKGDLVCTPAVDQNFPESWTAKSNKFMQIIQFGAQDPVLGALMADPNNLKLAKDLIGLTDFEIAGADSADKQLLEIAEMRSTPPVPDMAAIQQEVIQAQAAGLPAPPIDPTTLPMTSSVPLGQFDDDATELKVCVDWINGHEGQQAKRSMNQQDVEWYKNVELHAQLHQQRMAQVAMQQAMAMAAMQPPAQPGAQPGKNNQGSLEKPKQTPPEGPRPETAEKENPSPLM